MKEKTKALLTILELQDQTRPENRVDIPYYYLRLLLPYIYDKLANRNLEDNFRVETRLAGRNAVLIWPYEKEEGVNLNMLGIQLYESTTTWGMSLYELFGPGIPPTTFESVEEAEPLLFKIMEDE